MKQETLIQKLSIDGNSKIMLIVIDGLGGLPGDNGLTELEAAKTPNMDQLAARGICGLSYPIAPGITPGSGPGHLSLFGYDALEWDIGRGVLEALGVDFKMGANDLAARGNFCSIDIETGNITDRRAGRIPTEEGMRLTDRLKKITLPNVEVFIEPVKEYRFVLVLRGEGLDGRLTETDPQRIGTPSLPVEPLHPKAKKSAELLNNWLSQTREILSTEPTANSCNLRGISKRPDIPIMPDIYKMKLAAIASYPMYRGIASLVGMDVLETGVTIQDQIETLRDNWDNYDFFFFHVKKTDSYGEDGNFDGKKKVIEEFDGKLSDILNLNPDAIVITGDHSTPSSLKSHSWHELPVLLWSNHLIPDHVKEFGERSCMAGGLGHIVHKNLMPILMANAFRLSKYGA